MTLNLRLSTVHLFVLTTIVLAFSSCDHCKLCTNNFVRNHYVPDEILVIYKDSATDDKRSSIRQQLQAAGIDVASLDIKKCNACDEYVELWHADDIHTVIHAEGIQAGTVSGSKGVGEDTLARYSLNYLQHLPVDELPDMRKQDFRQRGEPMPGAGRDTIVIAVLDTGLDTQRVVNGTYQWKNLHERSGPGADDDSNCYTNDVLGWNFIDESAQVHDNNVNLHGTLVSQFIVSEFEKFSGNFPQIMTLKTHDNEGRGDLFSAICAIHYAIDKKVNIINASWGFYYYDDRVHPYLDSLVTKVLKEKGILFVTASGNKIAAEDEYAQARYQMEYGVTLSGSQLRDLRIHNFYPACLADSSNNVMVATTTDNTNISPTQNYSSRYVDFGVTGDNITSTTMKFQVPFASPSVFISGSSFATAVLTGKVGALARKTLYHTNLNKQDIIDNIQSGGSGVIQSSVALDTGNLVRNGKYIKRE